MTCYIKRVREIKHVHAVVAELAYAHDSGSCPLTWVWVQVPSTALIEGKEVLVLRLLFSIYRFDITGKLEYNVGYL